MSARRGPLILGAVALLVLVAYASGARRIEGPPLDPASTAADGTKALVTLLDQLGASVDIVETVPRSGPDRVALLVSDRLSREQADDLDRFISGGGRLVVADPRSSYAPVPAGSVSEAARGLCTIEALQAVDSVDAELVRFRDELADGICFGDDDGAIVSVRRVGAGHVIAIGGTDLLINANLGDADNAALVAALVAPRPGTQVSFLRPATPGTGDATLTSLISDPVRALLFQLLVAFVFVVLWRMRRLGAPVVERTPVAVEASELTRAAGRLFATNRVPARAAAVLREQAWSELRSPLGIPADASQDDVVGRVAAATGWPPDAVDRAVFGPVTSDDELLAVATQLAHLRQEVLHD